MTIDDQLSAYEVLQNEIRKQFVSHAFMLVDLAESTSFKTRHQQIEWLARLKAFHQTVARIVKPMGPAKLLGDGVLVSVTNPDYLADAVIGIGHAILTDLENLNKKSFPGEHALIARIVLNYGPAYFFDNDPQGTAIDKLFRMEKFVPNGCIGATEEFARYAHIRTKPVASFPLKGLPEPLYHGLILVGPQPPIQKITELEAASLASFLWSFPGHDTEPLNLVGGYIPTKDYYHVHVGDMNAKLNALHIVTSLGASDKVQICDSSEFRDAAYRQNIISIGGPCFNKITDRLMNDLPIRFLNIDDTSDETPLFDKRSNQRFSAEKHEGVLVKDWGLFVRRKNPTNPSRRVIIACGIESPSVDGIVRAFSPANPNFLELMKRIASIRLDDDADPIPDFYCVMPFSVEANHYAHIPAINDQTCHLHRLEG